MLIVPIILSLCCGLSIFLYGMRQMSHALKHLTENKLKQVVSTTITSPYKGALVGSIFTALVQSSSAITVLVVGLVDAGLMTLLQATGVIMGANLGTTITTQLITLNLTDFIPYFIFLGATFMLFSNQKKIHYLGHFLFSFGMLFLGLGIVKSSMNPIVSSDLFQRLILNVQGNLLLCILLGMSITFLIQSSSASTAILISLVSTGAISLYTAIPILFGHEIGTCMTAILSSLGGNTAGKQAALMHFTFNLLGTLLFLPFINQLINLTAFISATPERQVANIQLFFNLATVFLFLPWSKFFVKFAKFIFHDSKITSYQR
ncbi:MAG: Na/Pi cotransporter family protein [Turicibacter sp.]|nr:Na/Pi cotransporter family protein [Turicibacter sp.]